MLCGQGVGHQSARGFHRSGSYGDGGRGDSCRLVRQPAGACLLGDELCGEGRSWSMAAVVLTLVVGQYTEIGCEPEQFVVCKAKFPSAWMAMVHVVVDGEGFVDQDSVRLQRFDERGKQWAIEIEEDDNDVIFLFRKFRPYIGCSFEVYRPDTEIRKVSLLCCGSKLGHDLLIAVHRIDVKPM